MHGLRAIGIVLGVLATSVACKGKCPPPTCDERPAGLVAIQPGDTVPAPASVDNVKISCLAPAAGDVGFCNAIALFIGHAYDPTTGTVGVALGAVGTVDIANVVSTCHDSCTGHSGPFVDLTVPLEVCSIKVGADSSARIESGRTSSLDKHIFASLPTANHAEDWDLSCEADDLRSFCTDPALAKQEVVVDIWTGKVDVKTETDLSASAEGKVCCEDICLNGGVDDTLMDGSEWTFEGTVGVKLAAHAAFCAGAGLWLDAWCKTAAGADSPACITRWWGQSQTE